MAYGSSQANKAYYNRRVERAKEFGFTGYRQERKFREDHRADIDNAGKSLLWRETHLGGDYRSENPKQLEAFYQNVLWLSETDADIGTKRHGAVSYFIEWEGASEEEAIAAMRMIYGES